MPETVAELTNLAGDSPRLAAGHCPGSPSLGIMELVRRSISEAVDHVLVAAGRWASRRPIDVRPFRSWSMAGNKAAGLGTSFLSAEPQAFRITLPPLL